MANNCVFRLDSSFNSQGHIPLTFNKVQFAAGFNSCQFRLPFYDLYNSGKDVDSFTFMRFENTHVDFSGLFKFGVENFNYWQDYFEITTTFNGSAIDYALKLITNSGLSGGQLIAFDNTDFIMTPMFTTEQLQSSKKDSAASKAQLDATIQAREQSQADLASAQKAKDQSEAELKKTKDELDVAQKALAQLQESAKTLDASVVKLSKNSRANFKAAKKLERLL